MIFITWLLINKDILSYTVHLTLLLINKRENRIIFCISLQPTTVLLEILVWKQKKYENTALYTMCIVSSKTLQLQLKLQLSCYFAFSTHSTWRWPLKNFNLHTNNNKPSINSKKLNFFQFFMQVEHATGLSLTIISKLIIRASWRLIHISNICWKIRNAGFSKETWPTTATNTHCVWYKMNQETWGLCVKAGKTVFGVCGWVFEGGIIYTRFPRSSLFAPRMLVS